MTGHTRRRAAVAVAIAAAVAVAPAAASANPIEFFTSLFTGDAQTREVEDHTIDAVHNLQGTTINLFDYWVKERDSADYGDRSEVDDENGGINSGHDLKFSLGSFNELNNWRAPVRTGIVQNTLTNGYPTLNLASGIDGINDNQSLDYLFNASDINSAADERVDGKLAFTDVKGLFSVKDGYYCYNSMDNFASFNENDGSFSVYKQPAVDTSDPGLSENGQFFPFGNASKVFEEDANGQLVSKGVIAKSTDVNHWFGLSTTSRFVQPTGGEANGKAVTYEFSGDDDVWVFIDDVLVGDLGGVHSKADLTINFQTGDVSVTSRLKRGNDIVTQTTTTTLKDCFAAAGRPGEESNWSGNTFADNTYHTLKFFYLERGSADSNMSLKFNLVTVPESTIKKVDQAGSPVGGAEFALYNASETYEKIGEPVATGTTGYGDGSLTLVDTTGSLITFEDLYRKSGNTITHFVLDEVKAPEGYRISGDMHLKFDPNTGVIYSTNHWETGAYANAAETITSRMKMKTQDGGDIVINSDGQWDYQGNDSRFTSDNGTLFAAVLYRTGSGTSGESWKAIYGSALDGWTLSTSSTKDYKAIDDIVAAWKNADRPEQGYVYDFEYSPNGQYWTTIDELPGDIRDYYYVNGNADSTQYAVAMYYTSADSIAGATSENTVRIEDYREGDQEYDGDYGFTRQFAATFYVPDMYNRLIVQKVDQDDKPVNGAQFTMYDANPVKEDGTVNTDANPVGAPVTTKKLTKGDGGIDLEGAAIFEGKTGLVEGTYFIKETQAPTGYEINDTVIEVYVDGTGVYANAGAEGDGVTVRRGVGSLAETMAQFATSDDVDHTLHEVIASLQLAVGHPKDGQWKDAPSTAGSGPIHLTFGGKGAALEYGPAGGDGERSVWSDTGWPLARITQCLDPDHGSAKKTNLEEELGAGYNLRSLFSGTVTVRVTDQKVNDLEITKTVAGYKGMPQTDLAKILNKDFEFDVTLTIPGEGGAEGTPLPDGYAISVVDATTLQPIMNENGEPVSIEIKDGAASFTLKHNQKAVVENLPVETIYKVVEEEAAGFEVEIDKGSDKDASVDDARPREISGNLNDTDGDDTTLPAEPVAVVYNNTYSVTPIADQIEIPVEKTFVNDGTAESAWKKDNSFSFQLTPFVAGNPLPNGASGDAAVVEVKATADAETNPKAAQFVFDENDFTRPGTYQYSLIETLPTAALPGVTYSKANYTVTITVTDEQLDGTLEYELSMTPLYNDAGAQPDSSDPVSTAAFKNTHDANAASFELMVWKALVQLDGTVTSAPTDEFTFELKAIEGTNAASGITVDAYDVPMPASADGSASVTSTNDNWRVRLANIPYTQADVGYTYR